MSAATQRQRNGHDQSPVKVEATPEQLGEAVAYEQSIADEARRLREAAGGGGLTPALFSALWPLLRRPIPEGYIVEVSAGKGKPYPSKGIKSLQVQIDRLDNVLGPLAWEWETEWFDEGRVADVAVNVMIGDALLMRRARGGVNQASTTGNLYKGSETNAAKLAFARLGPGHEVYLGLTDLDPDVNEDAMRVQGEGIVETAAAASPLVTAEQAENLANAVEAAGLAEHLPTRLRAFAVDRIDELTVAQGMELWQWAQGGTDG